MQYICLHKEIALAVDPMLPATMPLAYKDKNIRKCKILLIRFLIFFKILHWTHRKPKFRYMYLDVFSRQWLKVCKWFNAL